MTAQGEAEGSDSDRGNENFEDDPEAPWRDPLSGEVDYQSMAEDLGVSPVDGDDLGNEYGDEP